MILEKNIFGGHITGHKKIERNGVPVGIVEGYIATWDIDRGKDKFVRGAFKESLERYRKTGRQIRLKDNHGRTVGGYPIENVREDDKGLFGIGEINLETQQGRELYSLIRQDVLSEKSVGYSVDDSEFKDNIRIIKKAEIWEGSIVDEPMNPNAIITAVKKVNGRSALPSGFADRAYKWDSSKADMRVREWAGGEEPNDKYASAFLWYDEEEKENYTAYKLQIADLIDGKLVIVPRAVFAVRAVLSGARGGVDVPESDQLKIKNIVNELYTDMEMEKPFDGEKALPLNLTEVKNMSKSTLSYVIRNCEMSKYASNFIAQSCLPAIMEGHDNEQEVKKMADELLAEMINIKNNFRRK